MCVSVSLGGRGEKKERCSIPWASKGPQKKGGTCDSHPPRGGLLLLKQGGSAAGIPRAPGGEAPEGSRAPGAGAQRAPAYIFFETLSPLRIRPD